MSVNHNTYLNYHVWVHLRESFIFIGESFWYAPSLTKDCILSLKSIFPVVGYSSLNVPAYGGHYGLFLASKNEVYAYLL